LERYFLTGIDGVCETLSVEPPWLLMTMPFNPKGTPPAGGFKLLLKLFVPLASIDRRAARPNDLFDVLCLSFTVFSLSSPRFGLSHYSV
jgi:hypothetical protein